MTPQESLLALARAVYGEPCDVLTGIVWIMYAPKYPKKIFDPANNDAQAMEVQLWMASVDEPIKICKGFIVLKGTTIDHDNTPASLREAIVQAACRVVGG